MPKTAVNKDRLLLPADYYVRSSRKLLRVKSIVNTELAKERAYSQLGRRIRLPYAAHHFRSNLGLD